MIQTEEDMLEYQHVQPRFYVGQEVVCVRDSLAKALRVGCRYTVDEVNGNLVRIWGELGFYAQGRFAAAPVRMTHFTRVKRGDFT